MATFGDAEAIDLGRGVPLASATFEPAPCWPEGAFRRIEILSASNSTMMAKDAATAMRSQFYRITTALSPIHGLSCGAANIFVALRRRCRFSLALDFALSSGSSGFVTSMRATSYELPNALLSAVQQKS